jgi:pilus assembly protein Flp/PilA
MNSIFALAHVLIARLLREDDGQGLTEYALILALIGLLAVGALHFLSGHINTVLSSAGSGL